MENLRCPSDSPPVRTSTTSGARRKPSSLPFGKATPEAVATFQEHLPAARDLTGEQVRKAGLRLADTQSAVARKMGFASWPQLARHVETLRALEGTWSFERLAVAGNALPAAALSASRILIDGDRFRTESPEATYERRVAVHGPGCLVRAA